MARGWESKSVESQQEEKNARESAGRDAVPLTPEERARRERLDSLRLSLSRTLDQLERATSQPHRAQLKRALIALEREIAGLD